MRVYAPGVGRGYPEPTGTMCSALCDPSLLLRGNLDSQHHSSAHGRLLAYLEWANDFLQLLVGQVSASDIDRLIRTRTFSSLLDGAGGVWQAVPGRGW